MLRTHGARRLKALGREVTVRLTSIHARFATKRTQRSKRTAFPLYWNSHTSKERFAASETSLCRKPGKSNLRKFGLTAIPEQTLLINEGKLGKQVRPLTATRVSARLIGQSRQRVPDVGPNFTIIRRPQYEQCLDVPIAADLGRGKTALRHPGGS
jgi:hypothetical protein